MHLRSLHALVVLAALAAPCTMHGQSDSSWVASWASAQQVPEPANALPATDLTDATLRQIVHLSLGGSAVRVRLSNAFGTTDLHLGGVHLARAVSPASSAIDTRTDRTLTFHGAQDVIIPAGADYWSDPVSLPISAGTDIAITLHLDTAPATETSHPGSRATSYLAHGMHLADGELSTPKTFEHWFFLSGIDVAASSQDAAIVALGDSITDGHGATTNGNDRWPDDLAQRLAQATSHRSVVNVGIGGNHVLTDGLGPNALARFNRDVLAQSRVRVLILLEGVNDLGALARQTPPASGEEHAALLQRLEAGYQQMIDRAHAQGLFVIGGTILPYTGSDYYHPAVADEAARQELNAWIRQPGHFDAVVDFDSVTRDPQRPDRLLPAYDSGDHLHPSPAGYRAMAAAIPLALLQH
ncbi:SGNH/GDSL hydrolase family protein [Silvibacterium dinghuense]|uniref:SGNH/GDSL hydrolase family protein n=2 Tax=Silvibacterium dinghuense TaxID=1560006 RepID=A0A4Q1SAH8_9BACT|nr:SGNH/GDSL hydrolase family protein [Silvibacterium dinghuense]